MSLKVGVETQIAVDKRYVLHNRSHAIGDVFDALAELLTNADDSYNRMFQDKRRARDGGDILIEHLAQRKGRSFIIIRDRAEGMDEKDIEAKLARTGAYESRPGNRGYMGRGAKNCSELGDLTFESIKDDRYYRCRITHGLKLKLEEKGMAATKARRGELGIPHGNGTSVTLELREGVRLPRLESLAAELPWHFALRDMMAEDSPSRVMLRKVGSTDTLRLIYQPPEGTLITDETYDVPGYPHARAHLRIWRSPEPLDEARLGFDRCGLLIKGERAIHECSLLSDEFKNDPDVRRYFGRIDCPHLDTLLRDYETRLDSESDHPSDNPRLVIDPNRRAGLERQHPFVKALLQLPIERLRDLLSSERARERTKQCEVADERTRARLARLAKLADRFLREQLDELEELSEGDDFDDHAFASRGALIYPTYLKVGVGAERFLTFYVRRAALDGEGAPVLIACDDPEALEVPAEPLKLRPHRSRQDRLVATFRVRGLKSNDSAVITARCNGLAAAEALAQVVELAAQDRTFTTPLEFERQDYKVRQGRTKSLKLFAKLPDIPVAASYVDVCSNASKSVVVLGRCKLHQVADTNYAEGAIVVRGRTLKSTATITATIGGQIANASVKVIDKHEERGSRIQFEIRDEDFGNFRALWADREGKPYLLLISARHDSLRRYLGPPEKDFPGQHDPLFRALIAEIVAESVCRKVLSMEARERPFDFPWAEMKRPDLIVDDVFAQFQQRLRGFVGKAHDAMLSDEEVAEPAEAAA